MRYLLKISFKGSYKWDIVEEIKTISEVKDYIKSFRDDLTIKSMLYEDITNGDIKFVDIFGICINQEQIDYESKT